MSLEQEWERIMAGLPCDCPAIYTIEPHGQGYALYHGRCAHRHGYNLINMVEPAWNFDRDKIEKLLNRP